MIKKVVGALLLLSALFTVSGLSLKALNAQTKNDYIIETVKLCDLGTRLAELKDDNRDVAAVLPSLYANSEKESFCPCGQIAQACIDGSGQRLVEVSVVWRRQ